MAGYKNEWYKTNNVEPAEIVPVGNSMRARGGPTSEQKAAAKEFAKGKWNEDYSIKIRKYGRWAQTAMNSITFVANTVAFGMSMYQIYNEKSAKQHWDELMANHTQGTKRVTDLLTEIHLQTYQLSKIEMSTKSKKFLELRLQTLIKVK